ncbi:hypothetical protein EVAR_62251_1 [Eumeta japonica]|uniref:Uncharacterized protein n=1 Tax=Eumeta variegata TaxID=151549 RepID=A0A4C1ZAY1_EUMVA|nr:hypothetical protein EVAR_62251_1 [Eumeta japonica]
MCPNCFDATDVDPLATNMFLSLATTLAPMNEIFNRRSLTRLISHVTPTAPCSAGVDIPLAQKLFKSCTATRAALSEFHRRGGGCAQPGSKPAPSGVEAAFLITELTSLLLFVCYHLCKKLHPIFFTRSHPLLSAITAGRRSDVTTAFAGQSVGYGTV